MTLHPLLRALLIALPFVLAPINWFLVIVPLWALAATNSPDSDLYRWLAAVPEILGLSGMAFAVFFARRLYINSRRGHTTTIS